MSALPLRTRAQTRHLVPHPQDPGCSISGILEHVGSASEPTAGREIAIILHGTMGHKDYLFQKLVASKLPIDSFRFDFRGNHETPGAFHIADFESSIQDLQAVVAYLSEPPRSYIVRLIISHSRGGLVAFKWLAGGGEYVKSIRGFIAIATRYRMEIMRDRASAYKAEWEKQGFFEWKVKVAGREVVGKIYPQDVEDFASWDTSFVWNTFPQNIDVLSMHGLADKTVPPYDSIIYAKALSRRSPGTHALHLIESADHNFVGYYDEVADTIVEWWAARENNSLKSGIWNPSYKGSRL